MWEWRAFGPPERLAAPEPVRDETRAVEERSDLYLLVRPDLGLKVRAFAGSEKGELKLRHDRDGSGVELWEKVFERRLPLEPPSTRELANLLGGESDARQESAADLARLCALAGFPAPRQALVRKRIAKAPFPPGFTIESVELDVTVNGRTRSLRSIALEAPTLELCLRLGDELGFPRAGASGLVVAGYPQALEALVQGAFE